MNDDERLRHELRCAREQLVRKRARRSDGPASSEHRLPLLPVRNGRFLRLALLSVEDLETHIERLERDLTDIEDGIERPETSPERLHQRQMRLTADTIYRHAEFGEVLVLDVHHVFETYDPDSQDGRLRSRVVRYASEWDDYGPMPSRIQTTPVDEFQAALIEPVRTRDGIESPWTDDR